MSMVISHVHGYQTCAGLSVISMVISHVIVISDVHGYQSCPWLSVMSRAIDDVHGYQLCPGLSAILYFVYRGRLDT